MKDKQISPLVGMIVGAAVVVLLLVVGYKAFLAPTPLPSVADHPPRPGYTKYPGSEAPAGSGSAPAAGAPAPSSP